MCCISLFWQAFEMCAPVGGGRGSTRKITYTNPYPTSRVLLLRSDHPDLLQFKEDRFEVSTTTKHNTALLSCLCSNWHLMRKGGRERNREREEKRARESGREGEGGTILFYFQTCLEVIGCRIVPGPYSSLTLESYWLWDRPVTLTSR